MNAPTLTIGHVLWALGIASAFIFWPTLGRYSGASGIWVTIIVLIGSVIGGAIVAYPTLKGYDVPGARVWGLMLFAGIVNGIACYFYAVKAVDPEIPGVTFIMAVVILMVVVAPIFGYLLNGSIISVKQWFGLATSILAIYLLAG